MTEDPTSPKAVTQYIGTVLRRKRGLIEGLKDVELDARAKRREADRAEASCFLNAEGSIPARKYKTDVDKTVETARAEADVAEVQVAYMRRMVAHCADEIDGARTAAATLRQEFTTLGLTDEGA